jgi:hypothetical protein
MVHETRSHGRSRLGAGQKSYAAQNPPMHPLLTRVPGTQGSIHPFFEPYINASSATSLDATPKSKTHITESSQGEATLGLGGDASSASLASDDNNSVYIAPSHSGFDTGIFLSQASWDHLQRERQDAAQKEKGDLLSRKQAHQSQVMVTLVFTLMGLMQSQHQHQHYPQWLQYQQPSHRASQRRLWGVPKASERGNANAESVVIFSVCALMIAKAVEEQHTAYATMKGQGHFVSAFASQRSRLSHTSVIRCMGDTAKK